MTTLTTSITFYVSYLLSFLVWIFHGVQTIGVVVIHFLGGLWIGIPIVLLVFSVVLFFSIPVLSTVIVLPYRMLARGLRHLGLLKDDRRWSVVYDAVSKDPIDPAYVTIYNTLGKVVATAVTDLDGRFGILLPQGRYRVVAQKTNYSFPSKTLAGKATDGHYHGLYMGEQIEITEREQALALNIPMDPDLKGDWNQEEKRRKHIYLDTGKTQEYMNARRVYFFLGLAIAASERVMSDSVLVTYLLYLYLFFTALGIIRWVLLPPEYYHSVVLDTVTGKPLSFARVRIYTAKKGYEVSHKMTSYEGQFVALVPRGSYYITIERRNGDGTYTLAHTSKPFMVWGSYIGRKFEA